MTDNEINIAIAEACGWTEIDGLSAKGLMGKPPGKLCSFDYLPDFCNNLNAMHEAEKGLIFSERKLYRHWLQRVKGYDLGDGIMIAVDECVHATARERAEAFLRTIGKWEDSENE